MLVNYYEKNNAVLLTLNRPDKRNSLNPDLIQELKIKFNEIEKDKNVKAVIITGEGESFCSGADLSYLNSLKDLSSTENEKDSKNIADLFLQIYNFKLPVIAAVNGPAIAGGCGLASVCDYIIAHPSQSKFGYSEVKIGFVPAIVSVFLIKKIGEGKAKELLLGGEFIDGKKALEIGLVSKLSENVIETSFDLANNLVKNSAYSMNLTKSLIHSVSNMSVKDAVEYLITLNTVSRASEDFKLGLEKFLNKK
jgi:methylglutaconyl-CoA hydratase